jgi:hypothetical protein
MNIIDNNCGNYNIMTEEIVAAAWIETIAIAEQV